MSWHKKDWFNLAELIAKAAAVLAPNPAVKMIAGVAADAAEEARKDAEAEHAAQLASPAPPPP